MDAINTRIVRLENDILVESRTLARDEPDSRVLMELRTLLENARRDLAIAMTSQAGNLLCYSHHLDMFW